MSDRIAPQTEGSVTVGTQTANNTDAERQRILFLIELTQASIESYSNDIQKNRNEISGIKAEAAKQDRALSSDEEAEILKLESEIEKFEAGIERQLERLDDLNERLEVPGDGDVVVEAPEEPVPAMRSGSSNGSECFKSSPPRVRLRPAS